MSQPPHIAQPIDWSQIVGPAGETALTHRVPEAILHLRTMLAAGAPWHRALLEAVGRWTIPEETFEGRKYRYLLQGEAFDWLLLAERLCRRLQEDRSPAPCGRTPRAKFARGRPGT